MGSQDRSVREKQLEKAQAEFDAHKAALTAKGMDERAMKKDAVLRSLRANVKKAKSRIASIEATAAHVAEMAEKNTKLEKASAKDQKKGKDGGKKKGDGAKGDGAKGDGAKGDGAKGDKGGGKKGK